MITEDYCSDELSKLLKEKGFDWDCDHYYKPNGEIVQTFHTEGSHHINSSVLYEHQCLAPTHQMAMKWLREKGYHIVIFTDSPKYEVKIQDLNDGSFNVSGITHTYDTYEEAVEAAIKYCLTKLINNETN